MESPALVLLPVPVGDCLACRRLCGGTRIGARFLNLFEMPPKDAILTIDVLDRSEEESWQYSGCANHWLMEGS